MVAQTDPGVLPIIEWGDGGPSVGSFRAEVGSSAPPRPTSRPWPPTPSVDAFWSWPPNFGGRMLVNFWWPRPRGTTNHGMGGWGPRWGFGRVLPGGGGLQCTPTPHLPPPSAPRLGVQPNSVEAPAGYQWGGVQAGAGAVGWGERQSSGAEGVVGKRSTPPIPDERPGAGCCRRSRSRRSRGGRRCRAGSPRWRTCTACGAA